MSQGMMPVQPRKRKPRRCRGRWRRDGRKRMVRALVRVSGAAIVCHGRCTPYVSVLHETRRLLDVGLSGMHVVSSPRRTLTANVLRPSEILSYVQKVHSTDHHYIFAPWLFPFSA